MRNWADVETNQGQSESEITGSARMTTETDAFPGVSRVTSRVKIVPLASSTDFCRRCRKVTSLALTAGQNGLESLYLGFISSG
jgi:hypothetical protein